jgi:hypothetical protein
MRIRKDGLWRGAAENRPESGSGNSHGTAEPINAAARRKDESNVGVGLGQDAEWVSAGEGERGHNTCEARPGQETSRSL